MYKIEKVTSNLVFMIGGHVIYFSIFSCSRL